MSQSGSALTAASDDLLQSAVKKNLVRVVPILAIAYFFNYIDRTNVGFAALRMNRDLGLSNAEFGAAAGLFFVGYCLLEVPSNLALYRFGARRWLARIMISWGLLSAATAFVTGPMSFNAVRILCGAAEAGFFPGVVVLPLDLVPGSATGSAFSPGSWSRSHSRPSSGGPVSVAVLGMDGVAGLKGLAVAVHPRRLAGLCHGSDHLARAPGQAGPGSMAVRCRAFRSGRRAGPRRGGAAEKEFPCRLARPEGAHPRRHPVQLLDRHQRYCDLAAAAAARLTDCRIPPSAGFRRCPIWSVPEP